MEGRQIQLTILMEGKTLWIVLWLRLHVDRRPAGSLYAPQGRRACLPATCCTPIAYYEAMSQNNISRNSPNRS